MKRVVTLKRSIFIIAIITSLCCTKSLLLAGNTGKISGKVIDTSTGKPLPGANIIISHIWVEGKEVPLDVGLGAASDQKGDYFVINISVGTYSTRCIFMGYREEKRTQVVVNVDRTTRVNFEIEPQVISGQEVVVTALRHDQVERDITSTRQIYNTTQVQEIGGVTNVGDIIDLQADVSEGHFRGGRSGEEQYLLGKASIINPLSNSPAFQPILAGLEEVQVITSGFSAEYGNAQSGIIIMIPKEGGSKWRSRIEFSGTLPEYKHWGGSIYDPDNLFYYNKLINTEEWLEDSPIWIGYPNFRELYGFLPHSPTRDDSLRIAGIEKVRWLQMVRDVGMEYDNRMDYRFDFSTGGPISKSMRFFIAIQQNQVNPIIPTVHPNKNSQIISTLTHQKRNDKIRFTGSFNQSFTNVISSGGFRSWTFSRVLKIPKQRLGSQNYSLGWKHVFNLSTFMDLDFNILRNHNELKPEFLDPDKYFDTAVSKKFIAYYIDASDHSTNNINCNRSDASTLTYNLTGNVTSQMNTNHLLKMGLQLSYYDLNVFSEHAAADSISVIITDFNVYPYEGAVYIQDKIEYEAIVANIGFRYDFYNFNYEYFSSQFSPLRNPFYDPNKPYLERGDYYDRELAAKEKTKFFSRLEPRFGIALPISEKAVIHINYGNFLQRPDINYLLYNQINAYNDIIEIGNPRLKPEQTYSYDLGLVHALPYGLKLDVSAYYKDVKDLIEQAIFVDEQQKQYRTYQNRDYANIKGFHVNVELLTRYMNAFVRYNYQTATGKSSTPLDAPVYYFEDPAPGQDPIELPDPEDIYLDFDRRHRMVSNLRLKSPEKCWPNIGKFSPLANLTLSGTFRITTGRPYTWDVQGLGLKYNKRTPTTYDLKCRLQKRFQLGSNSYTAYFEGFNLLNTKKYRYGATFTNTENLTKYETDRDNLYVYDLYAPYNTSQITYIINNTPRSFRLGLILRF